MGLKIVYDVISGEKDNYFEQAWASMFSLRHFNPDAHIVLLTDDSTVQTIEKTYRKKAKQLIDDIVVVPFEKQYSNKEKSRWIKTSMRQLVNGDFLFIDADTIVAGALDKSYFDGFPNFIGAVLDYNCSSRIVCHSGIFKIMYVNRLKSIYGIDYNEGTDVYNSGVLFVRDVPEAYALFDAWHKNWLIANDKGVCLDQLPLVKTCQDMGNPIRSMSGIYNCQVKFSIQYLHEAIILHTFSHQQDSSLSPILGSYLYDEIKRLQDLNDKIKGIILNAKDTFVSPCFLVGKEWVDISFMPIYILLKQLYFSKSRWDKRVLSFLNLGSRAVMLLLRKMHG